jgi:hypothetical protein
VQKLLLISGPVGVGKTSVADEVSSLLDDANVSHTFVDLDGLSYTYPRDDDDPYGDDIALENLSAIWGNSRKRGVDYLIIARVIESREYADKLAASVNIKTPIICRLTARDETLLARVRNREIGSGLEWHEKRALQLSGELEESRVDDFCIATDLRSVTQVARDVLAQIGWLD